MLINEDRDINLSKAERDYFGVSWEQSDDDCDPEELELFELGD